MYVYVYAYVYVYLYVYLYMYMYMHMYTYIFIQYVCTNVHVQSLYVIVSRPHEFLNSEGWHPVDRAGPVGGPCHDGSGLPVLYGPGSLPGRCTAELGVWDEVQGKKDEFKVDENPGRL